MGVGEGVLSRDFPPVPEVVGNENVAVAEPSENKLPSAEADKALIAWLNGSAVVISVAVEDDQTLTVGDDSVPERSGLSLGLLPEQPSVGQTGVSSAERMPAARGPNEESVKRTRQKGFEVLDKGLSVAVGEYASCVALRSPDPDFDADGEIAQVLVAHTSHDGSCG